MIKLYAIHCGLFIGPAASFIEGGEGQVQMPVLSYLIEHPQGKVLFDTGMNQRFQRELQTRIAPGGGYSIALEPSQEIGSRLQQMGVDPAEIRYVLLSHLHMDHCAGVEQIPNATLVMQRAEHEVGMAGEGGYDRSYFDLGHSVQLVDGEHDVFGDGAIVLFPTPGHTRGHQSARVRLAGGDVILAADCCYFQQSLDEMRPPPHGFSREQLLGSIRRLGELRRQGARILFGHDPQQWGRLMAAPSACCPERHPFGDAYREIATDTRF